MQNRQGQEVQSQAAPGASAQMSGFLEREFGLLPHAVYADLHGDLLCLHLSHALAPMAQMVVQERAGTQIVQGVYDVLLAGCHEQFAAMASAMVGLPVRHVGIAVDGPRDMVTIEFLLQRPARQAAKKEDGNG